METLRGTERWLRTIAGVALLAVACEDAPAGSGAQGGGENGAGGEASAEMDDTGPGEDPDGEPKAPQRVAHVALFDSFEPQALNGGFAGQGGAAPELPSGPPYGTSVTCGDAIVGDSEECDDGAGGADACTALCETRDVPAGPEPAAGQSADRYLGAGRHPVSGLDRGFITTYVEAGGEEPAIGATLFNIWGQPAYYVTVSEGASPIYEANPVAAALPDGSYAVAWSDFDGDGSDLGVALRRVEADGALGRLLVANHVAEFSQLNPDMIWTGSQLVVAWEDYADAFNGPDLRYRTFDQDLNATSGELDLAIGPVPEAAVALAPFNGGWAAAYREGAADGSETVVVKVGDESFRVGPFYGGPLDDRPALVELDATHLLVVFSAGTDPGAIGVNNVPRLRYSVIDVESEVVPTFASLDPLDDVFTQDAAQSHLSPSVAPGTDGLYVAWRSEGRPGDAAGDQIWLKYLTWDATRSPALEVREQEMLIPRLCESSTADQRTPALARVGLPPSGALAMAWDDYASLGEPGVTVHYAPTHERDGRIAFKDDFRGTSGPWSSHWTSDPAPMLTTDLHANEGRVMASAGGQTVHYVNHHSALDVELTTQVRFGNNGESLTMVARRADDSATTYLGFRFGTSTSEHARVFTMINGIRTDIQTQAMPYVFQMWAQKLAFNVRFRVRTDPTSGVISLAGKAWLAALAEPTGWTVSGNVPAGTPTTTFDGRVGRFGIHTAHSQSNRTIYIDNFVARFIEGAALGEAIETIEPDLPLKRSAVAYRTCTPTSGCTAAQGCCTSGDDCVSGWACSAAHGEFHGVGSHASVCTPAHCTDQKLTDMTDEVRADCGGADCPACTCAPSQARGTSGYCTDTCPCGIGDADCVLTTSCLPGLFCAQEKGFKYGWGQGTDVCTPTHCVDRVQSGDETGVDIGGSCGHVACFPSANGGYQHCSPSCPCPKGEGNVNYKDECQGNLVVGVGARWGFTFDVCVAPHCANNVKDADETGKDCGGADCGPICP